MALEDHVRALTLDRQSWNCWRSDNLQVLPDLSGASLPGLTLSAPNFVGADLTSANLSGLHATHADFSFADLSGINLSESALEHAWFQQSVIGVPSAGFRSLAKAPSFRSARLIKCTFDTVTIADADMADAVF